MKRKIIIAVAVIAGTRQRITVAKTDIELHYQEKERGEPFIQNSMPMQKSSPTTLVR